MYITDNSKYRVDSSEITSNISQNQENQLTSPTSTERAIFSGLWKLQNVNNDSAKSLTERQRSPHAG